MTSNNINSVIEQARAQAMQADADRRAVIKGIRTVCAEIEESIDAGGNYALNITWTTSDGVTFRTYDSGTYAGGSMNTLCKIWQCEPDEITDKAIDESREVFFYGMSYRNRDGEQGEMQKFRRVNALDRAHAETERQAQQTKKGAK